MRRVLLALLVAVVATPAFATDVYLWNSGGNYENILWTAPTSWILSDKVTPSPPPVDGDRINLNKGYSVNHCLIDVAGATLNLPTSGMGYGYGGRNWSFYDSATLTPNAHPGGQRD